MAKIGEKFKPLDRQTIVITGASSGIGLATAEMAARRGARVVISSRNEDDLNNIANKLNTRGAKVLAVKADVTKIEDLRNLRQQAIDAFGPIDTWINNAGGSIYGPLLEIPEEEERALFETNFWGVRHGCHVAVAALKEHGGVLINVGSEPSLSTTPLQGIYTATKYAVKAYTDALRIELDHDNIPIAVALVRPTMIDTPLPDHAVNHLKGGSPSLPDPVYHPDYVAKAILDCAEKPKSDVYVGLPSRFTSFMELLMPKWAEKKSKKVAFTEQIRGTGVPHTKDNEALREPALKEGELLGHHIGKIKTKKGMKSSHITDSKIVH